MRKSREESKKQKQFTFMVAKCIVELLDASELDNKYWSYTLVKEPVNEAFYEVSIDTRESSSTPWYCDEATKESMLGTRMPKNKYHTLHDYFSSYYLSWQSPTELTIERIQSDKMSFNVGWNEVSFEYFAFSLEETDCFEKIARQIEKWENDPKTSSGSSQKFRRVHANG